MEITKYMGKFTNKCVQYLNKTFEFDIKNN